MPLLDHFHPPLQEEVPWTTLHHAWATFIMQQLNRSLPRGFLALAHIHLGGQLQVDVAAGQNEPAWMSAPSEAGVATAAALWAPPRPALTAPLDPAILELFQIHVFFGETMRLVAAIELVSPRNKDRPAARRAFAAKVAGYLQKQVGVVVVDVVTDRHESLHEELVRLLGLGEEIETAFTADLYATAYRPVADEEPPQLEMWTEELTVGAALPTLPLWIAANRAVPLDLESTYRAALGTFRLPPGVNDTGQNGTA
jgi:Protein of unknown function (DUF4058)